MVSYDICLSVSDVLHSVWQFLCPSMLLQIAGFSSFYGWVIGEGNGIPLQYSCLENPRDRGAWWAAVHSVAKTEQLPFHFSLSSIGEGNGNPLQCSCLENPRDGGAWWAAVYGVAQSRTWLKQLSSSSRAFPREWRAEEVTRMGSF